MCRLLSCQQRTTCAQQLSLGLLPPAGLSTYLPLRKEPPLISEANMQTPIFQAHGDSDYTVSARGSELSTHALLLSSSRSCCCCMSPADDFQTSGVRWGGRPFTECSCMLYSDLTSGQYMGCPVRIATHYVACARSLISTAACCKGGHLPCYCCLSAPAPVGSVQVWCKHSQSVEGSWG